MEIGTLKSATAPELVLTGEGRRLLRDRRRALGKRSRALLDRFERGETNEELHYQLTRTHEEIAAISAALASIPDADGLAHNPDFIELGDVVDVEWDDGSIEHFVIAHPIEAALDDQRISPQSPLGRALTGKRVGDVAEFRVGTQTQRCVVRAIERGSSQSPNGVAATSSHSAPQASRLDSEDQ